MLPIEEGLLLLLRVAFFKSYPENLYSLFFLQISKKGKTLLTFFLNDEKESKQRKNRFRNLSASKLDLLSSEVWSLRWILSAQL
jgi:hypothetical protein